MLERDRLRQIVEAGRALSSELELDSLLQRIVEVAASLTGARYAALGVIDERGTRPERFVTAGLDRETEEAIGRLPEGQGVMSLQLTEARPLRLADTAEHPVSVGYPRAHPPRTRFLGVPILLRAKAFGNLYLAEKDDGELTEEDEEVATLLAAHAAVAIENARLYEAARSWARELEALDDIAEAMADERDFPALLSLVVDQLRELTGARIATIWLPVEDGSLELRAVSGEWPDGLARMRRRRRDSKLARVFERGRSERLDAVLDDPEIDQATARLLGLKTGLWAPLLVRSRPVGVLAAYDKLWPDTRFSQADVRTAERLAVRAAAAVTNRLRVVGGDLSQLTPAPGSRSAT
jgi:GAF domain-containing protein